MHFITAFRYDTEKGQVLPIKQERVKTKGVILSNIKKKQKKIHMRYIFCRHVAI